MSRNTKKLFIKALHLANPWKAFSMNIDDIETGVDIRIRSKGRWNTPVPIAGAYAKVMTNVKGPDITWISSIWNAIPIVQYHVWGVRNAGR